MMPIVRERPPAFRSAANNDDPRRTNDRSVGTDRPPGAGTSAAPLITRHVLTG